MQNSTACKELLKRGIPYPFEWGNPDTGSFTKSDNPDEMLHFI